MAGSKHNIEHCLVCGLLLIEGRCSSCDSPKSRKRITIPDLAVTNPAKSVSKKSAPKVEVNFQSVSGIKGKHATGLAFLLDKTVNERFELAQAVSKVGRDRSNNVSIEADHHVSRYHAWIFHNKNKYWIEDLGSTNGTLLNGKPITVRTSLRAGDKLTFGKTELIFVIE